jgi:putative colanic acid biosynthesis glycosyltransferase
MRRGQIGGIRPIRHRVTASHPAVSIIIPTRNAEARIAACLESCVSQTIPCQIIVADGLSTDKTAAIAESFGPKVTVDAASDNGVYDAMNRALASATGDWILFLGADDALASADALETALQSLSRNADARVICAAAMNTDRPSRKIRGLNCTRLTTALYWRNEMHHQGVLYHRSLFQEARFDTRFRILADYAFNLDLLKAKTPWVSSPVLLSRCGSEGISKTFAWRLYKEELRLKQGRIPFWAGVLNCLWVPLKFLYKGTSKNG